MNFRRQTVCAAAAVALGVGLVAAGASNVHAQGECGCVVPMAQLPASGPIGEITAASGNITLVSVAGPQAAGAGAPVQLGDQLTVGPQSTAVLAIGDCAINLQPQTEAAITQQGSNICVRVSDVSVQAGAPQNMVPLVIGGAVAVGGAALLFSSGTRTPVSP